MTQPMTKKCGISGGKERRKQGERRKGKESIHYDDPEGPMMRIWSIPEDKNNPHGMDQRHSERRGRRKHDRRAQGERRQG